MSSSIFFRFKSQKEPLQITFDGTSLSVFEVKRDIITLSKLGDGTDFDLEIYTADTNEKYDDDTTQIPRSSTVIARRLPATRQGAGKAARYVTGKMPVNAKNAHRIEPSLSSSAKGTPVADPMRSNGKEKTEEEKLADILGQNTSTWKAEQEAMSHKPVVRSYNKPAPVPDKPLPPGYICHRCGEKGHWIQACPTNNDPNFDNRPKFRRTTGIPRSFLKVVEKPTELGDDGKIDVSKLPQGVMYTANGEWVIAEADTATWNKIQEKQNAAAEKAKEASEGDQDLKKRGLQCEIHNGAFNEPVKTPCCGKTYCRDCIENVLLDGDLLCPNCGEQVLLDNLEPDDDMVEKMKAYEEEIKAEKKVKQEKEASKSPSAAGTPRDTTQAARELSAIPEVKVNGTTSSASTPNSKKRPAEEELTNDRKPSNPATEAMKRTSSKQGTATPNLPSSSNTPKPAQPPMAPAADMNDFQRQMSAMAASMAPMQNGMPAMMNPMMGNFNPAMMNGMGMGMMGMNPGMMGMPGMGMGSFNGMNGMNGMGGMGGMGNMNGWGGNQMMGNGGGWQGGNNRGGMQGGYGRGGGYGNGGNQGNDGPYMRQPVNPQRQRGKFNRGRGGNYQQM